MGEILFNSYFSGAGLFDLGLKMGGLTPNQSFELNTKACDTLRLNFDHKVIQTDLRHKTCMEDLDCDVMVGTYPCTKYSAVADLFGQRTGDELFLHMFRHIALRQPELFIIENVPGHMKFEVPMECFTKIPNYYIQVYCPLNANIWLPQNRDRLILIGSKKPFDWSEPKGIRRKKLKDIIERDAKIILTDSIYSRMSGKYRDLPIISDPEIDDISPTAVAHYHKDRSTRLLKDKRSPLGVRPYTVREYGRLQGVPDWFQFAGSENDAYKMIGNGVPVDMGIWLGREIRRYFNNRSVA